MLSDNACSFPRGRGVRRASRRRPDGAAQRRIQGSHPHQQEQLRLHRLPNQSQLQSTDLDQVTCDSTHLPFAVTKLNLSYDGEWNIKEDEWTGSLTFQQVYVLALKRVTLTDLALAVHKRPQEEAITAGPLPYEQNNVEFENASRHNRVAGPLSMPKGGGPFPAIVMVSGTGHNTRDEDVWGHKVFIVLANAFSRRGIAVFRYDKRGVGDSTGNFDTATTVDFAPMPRRR